MKIVIDIPEDDFNSIYHGGLYFIGHDRLDECITEAFQTARIIPKGHGDLIDLNTIHLGIEKFHCKGDWETANWEVEKAKVVIPADKGE